MKIINLIKSWFESQKKISEELSINDFTGAILPPQSEIDTMVKQEEIVASMAPVIWNALDLQKLPTWVQFSQGLKNECVACTKALMDSIKFYKRNSLKREVKFSADWIYKNRLPKVAGMVGTRAIDITRDIGNIFDSIFPDCSTDDQIDAVAIDSWMYDEAKVWRTNDTPILPAIKDIDTLVSTMQVTNKPIMVWFEFRYAEWQSVPYLGSLASNIKHSTCFIPPKNPGEMTYGIYEGEKAIVIQDSWGLQYGLNGKRIIKESFFKERNVFNQYDMLFKFDASNSTIRYDGTIVSFQKCMRSIGLFPTNIDTIESFGPVSRSSCISFQVKYGLSQTGTRDAATTALLYQMFP